MAWTTTKTAVTPLKLIRKIVNDNQDGDNMEDNEGVEEQLEEEPEVNADNIDEFIKSK